MLLARPNCLEPRDVKWMSLNTELGKCSVFIWGLFKWLHGEHGWLQISFFGTCEDAAHALLRWRGMSHDHIGFALQLSLPTHVEGVHQDVQGWKATVTPINSHGHHSLLMLEHIGEGDVRRVLNV